MEMPPPIAHLEAYRDKLVPGAPEQLAALWGPELSGLIPEAIAEVIRVRLASPEYAHYLKSDEQPPER